MRCLGGPRHHSERHVLAHEAARRSVHHRQNLRLDRENWTVIGVAARGFEHVGGDYRSPLQGDTVAIWRPLPVEITPANADCMKGCHYTNAIARFAPGVTERDDLDRILNELADGFPISTRIREFAWNRCPPRWWDSPEARC